MVQTADLRDGDHTTIGGWFHLTPDRRVAVQGEVRPAVVVIDEILAQEVSEVLVIKHDHVVKALAPDGADDPLDVRILPRRLAGGDDLSDSHSFDSGSEIGTVSRMAISEEIAGEWLIAREGLDQLLCCPRGAGIRGHVEVNDPPAVVGKDNEAEQEPKCGLGDDEEITGDSGAEMILETSPPALGGWPLPSPGHVLRHGGFGHVMTEQPELGLDARRALGAILL